MKLGALKSHPGVLYARRRGSKRKKDVQKETPGAEKDPKEKEKDVMIKDTRQASLENGKVRPKG